MYKQCMSNPKNPRKPPIGKVKRGTAPREYWQIYFLGLPKCGQTHYLLVLVDTLSGCPEDFFYHYNQSRKV